MALPKIIYDPGAGPTANWLTSVINTGVEQYGARLVASHTKRSAPAGR